jgi:hypothetical protein
MPRHKYNNNPISTKLKKLYTSGIFLLTNLKKESLYSSYYRHRYGGAVQMTNSHNIH